MRLKSSILLLLLCVLPAGTVLAARKFDPCKLLTRSEIKAVQGEPVTDAKSSERTGGGFVFAQCYYTVATHIKSVSLEVTRPDPNQGAVPGPRDHWKELFHGDVARKAQDEEKESGKPQPVAGVGEEAFWTGNPIVGALYVLKGQSYLRISIGGSEDQAVKIQKAKALAGKAVKRL